jgi:mRNA degradation ribonuclease J1/J2
MSLATHRMIFSVFSSDILRIRQICNIAHEYGKRVAMTGIKRQKLISEASSPKACLIAATLLA